MKDFFDKHYQVFDDRERFIEVAIAVDLLFLYFERTIQNANSLCSNSHIDSFIVLIWAFKYQVLLDEREPSNNSFNS